MIIDRRHYCLVAVLALTWAVSCFLLPADGGYVNVSQGTANSFFVGLSTDSKPTTTTNAIFIERDTGKISTYSGSAWSTVNAAGGLYPLYSLDFTAQPTQNLRSDVTTSATVDGKVWYVLNGAQSSTFDILNGTGLRIVRNASTNSPPRFETGLLTLAPTAKPFRNRVLFWFRIINNSAAVTNSFVHGQVFGPGGLLNIAFGPAYTGGTGRIRLINDGTSFTYVDTTANYTDDVHVFVLDGQFGASYYTGFWSDGWPAWNDLRGRGNATWVVPSEANCNSLFFSPSGVSLGVAADETTAGSAATSLTWTHLLIESSPE